MEKNFWLERWDENQIGFHKDVVNPNLEGNIEKLKLKTNDRVFVPLCGKSLDLLWLASKGYKVIGVELSEKAVKALYQENDIPYEIKKIDNFSVYYNDQLEIYCGDFFEFKETYLAGISGVYDRASIIALPSEMRIRYFAKMNSLISPNIKTLLVALSYNQKKLSGPPFSVTRSELESNLKSSHIELVSADSNIKVSPKFKENGVVVTESVYIISKS